MKGRPGRIHTATIDNAGQSADQVRVLQRSVSVGPVVLSDITFLTDMFVDCDAVGTGFYVHLPVSGRLQSSHRGAQLTATREVAAVYQPGGGPFSGRWAAGTRVLCVRLDDAELRATAGPYDTVAAVARRWGFTHPGRFAAAYEAKYGQSPGRTLRAARCSLMRPADAVRGHPGFVFRTITRQSACG